MGSYRKRPVVVEAFRFDMDAWPTWFCEAVIAGSVKVPDGVCPAEARIQTLEGVMTAESGDWVIRGVEGELYGCKDSVFRATYDEVVDGGGIQAGIAAAKERRERTLDTAFGRTETPSTAAFEADKSQLNTGLAGNAPKKSPTWRLRVFLACGYRSSNVYLTFSSERQADDAFEMIQKWMGDPSVGRPTATVRHDEGRTSCFAADVRMGEKVALKEYGYGEDL